MRSPSCWPSSFRRCWRRSRSPGGSAPRTRALVVCPHGITPDARAHRLVHPGAGRSSSSAASPGSARTLDPARAVGFERQAARSRGRLTRLEVAVHLPRSRTSPASTGWWFPSGVPLHFRITSASVFNVFFVPQLGSEIYCHVRHDEPTQPAGRPRRRLPRTVCAFQWRRLLRIWPSRWKRCAPGILRLGQRLHVAPGPALDDAAYREPAKTEPGRQALHLPGRCKAGCSTRSFCSNCRPARGRRRRTAADARRCSRRGRLICSVS